eukprot:COSAG02_NODE_4410_length_5388_cov_2.471167_5_plen_125_part_00
MAFAVGHFQSVTDSKLALVVMVVGLQACVGLRGGGVHSIELQSHDLCTAAARRDHRHDVCPTHCLQHSHGFSDVWESFNRKYDSPLLVESRYDLAEPVGTITMLLLLDGRLPTLLVRADSLFIT